MIGRSRRWVALGVTAAGLGLAAFSAVQVTASGSPRALPTPFALSPASAASASASTPSPSVVSSPPAVSVPRADGTSPPTGLTISALSVHARVTPVSTASTDIAVPDDVHTVGWWTASAAPGAAIGSVVVVGHVDSEQQGAGALYHLDAVRPGAQVVLTLANGLSASYAVTALQVIPKTAGIPADVLSSSAAPRLTVITCGGPFDRDSRSYRDNIVVTAVPAG